MVVADTAHHSRESEGAQRSPQVDLQSFDIVRGDTDKYFKTVKPTRPANIFPGIATPPAWLRNERIRRSLHIWSKDQLGEKCAIAANGLLVHKGSGRAYGISNLTSHEATDPGLTDPRGFVRNGRPSALISLLANQEGVDVSWESIGDHFSFTEGLLGSEVNSEPRLVGGLNRRKGQGPSIHDDRCLRAWHIVAGKNLDQG